MSDVNEYYDKTSPGLWYAALQHSPIGGSHWAIYAGNRCIFISPDPENNQESEFNTKFIVDLHNKCWELKFTKHSAKNPSWFHGFIDMKYRIIEMIDHYLMKDAISRHMGQNMVSIIINLRDRIESIDPDDT